jgi:hypothetical protein
MPGGCQQPMCQWQVGGVLIAGNAPIPGLAPRAGTARGDVRHCRIADVTSSYTYALTCMSLTATAIINSASEFNSFREPNYCV